MKRRQNAGAISGINGTKLREPVGRHGRPAELLSWGRLFVLSPASTAMTGGNVELKLSDPTQAPAATEATPPTRNGAHPLYVFGPAERTRLQGLDPKKSQHPPGISRSTSPDARSKQARSRQARSKQPSYSEHCTLACWAGVTNQQVGWLEIFRASWGRIQQTGSLATSPTTTTPSFTSRSYCGCMSSTLSSAECRRGHQEDASSKQKEKVQLGVALDEPFSTP